MSSITLAAAPAVDPAAYRSRLSAPGVAGIAVAHLAVLAILASQKAPPPPDPVAALMVEVVAPAPPAVPLPSPALARSAAPRPRAAAPVAPPVLAAPAQASASTASYATAAPETPAAPVAAPAPVAVSAPRFDAEYLHNPAPFYPAVSRRLGEEGRVVLRVFVDPDGRPGQIEIKTTSGSPRLDQAAQEAVARWKFIAARRGDDAVGAWVLVPIAFNLKG